MIPMLSYRARKMASSSSNFALSVEEVCDFLKRRSVQEEVLNRFRNEKMDRFAVTKATEKDLVDLGLTQKGDVMALKSFCGADKKEEINEKKRKLLSEFYQSRSKNKKAKIDESLFTDKPDQKKSIEAGLMHFNAKQQKYTTVRLNKGGGTRKLDIPLNANKFQIIRELKAVFFPNDENALGNVNEMFVSLADFQGKEIEKKVFTLGQYIKENKLTKVKLYLLTKTIPCDDDSDCDLDFKEDIFTASTSTCSIDLTQDQKSSNLIGSSEDRNMLRQQQDKEFEKSLEADKAKCRLDNIMKARASRVPPEPTEESDTVTISVRHITLGTKKRNFDKSNTVSAVYDWVGSLGQEPENFTLSTHTQEVQPCMPISSLHNTVLNMTSSSDSPSFPDDDIQFYGFGQASSSQDDTIPVNVSSTDDATKKQSRTLRIRRTSLMKDMIQEFKCENIMKEKLIVVVMNEKGEEEKGVDNGGVLRDVLSAFWEDIYVRCSMGEDERVPCNRHDLLKEDWTAIARVLIKGFQELKFFPVKLCKVVTVMSLYGENAVTKEMLLSSFEAYVSQDERDLIKAALDCSLTSEQYDDWCDFLDRFSCKRIPNADKAEVESLLYELAHKELIKACRYVTNDCWNVLQVLCKEEEFSSVFAIEDLYDQVKPTNKKVVQLFVAHPETTAERDVFGYLQRFIRGLNSEKLSVFLRYCTGASVLCVKKVSVDFTTDDGLGRRPIAHTCGPSLHLPTTYNTFPEFREEFNAILSCGYWEIDIV